MNLLKGLLLALALSASLPGCGGGEDAPSGGPGAGTPGGVPASPVPAPLPPAIPAPGPGVPDPAAPKSAKRGIAYDLASPADLAALSPGVSWWYNWSPRRNAGVPADHGARYAMDFLPMMWNGTESTAEVETFLAANPGVRYLLVMNEPNLVDQSNLTPLQAAQRWPVFEGIAARTGVQIVGPAMNWGTMPGYADPVAWLDAFYDAYRTANGGRDPRIDYLAFHWYDYGLAGQLDRLKKYGKAFWVTEFANWHSQPDGAQIDSPARQKAQMTDMVATCEARADVFRYAWFTGRWDNDTHFTSLLGADGRLSELGSLYVSLPFR
ncbi:glycosyl hydrolase [Cupriavidus sp. 30B13]|uniref:glycosyl hydrolase n=1 Tax=Cupriavidus sp. 30B13 TaxID=3384241 RepID=UPI003B906BDD